MGRRAEPARTIVGENIDRYRDLRGLSLTELELAADVSHSTMNAIRMGKRKGQADTHSLIKIAKALGVTLDDLVPVEFQHIDRAVFLEYQASDDAKSIGGVSDEEVEWLAAQSLWSSIEPTHELLRLLIITRRRGVS